VGRLGRLEGFHLNSDRKWAWGLGIIAGAGILAAVFTKRRARAPLTPPPSSPVTTPAPATPGAPPSAHPRMGKGVTLVPGLWWAGFHAPFFISNGMVKSRAEELGFINIRFFDRDDQAPPVNPLIDPAYRDDWDTWASAEYHGPQKSLDLPAQPDWLLHKHFPGQS
jgi:hypothetical protein